MAKAYERVGCIDKTASNYDPSTTYPCANAECCRYDKNSIDGCTDPYALNYNPNATKNCEEAIGGAFNSGIGDENTVKCIPCRYDKNNDFESASDDFISVYDSFDDSDVGVGVGTDLDLIPNYPYDVNVNDALCIRDTGYEELGWVTDNGTFGEGANFYFESLGNVLNNADRIPNWGSDGKEEYIGAAFIKLNENKPNSRVFINRNDLTPWIIPLYSGYEPLIGNPNITKFESDCSKVGGTIYAYTNQANDTGYEITSQIYDKDTQLVEAQTQLNTYNTYLDSLSREKTEDEILTLENLQSDVNTLTAQRDELISNTPETLTRTINLQSSDGFDSTVNLNQTLNSNSDLYAQDLGSSDTDINIVGSSRYHFVSCLCEVDTEKNDCKSRVYTDTELQGFTEYKKITKQSSTCIKSYDEYVGTFGKLYGDNGWNGEPTDFFNTFLFESMGLTPSDAEFVVNNSFNTNLAEYPVNSGNILQITGSDQSSLLLQRAFENGANLYIPFDVETSTNIINKKDCCDLVGGIFKSGTYKTTFSWGSLDTDTGVCLCQEITTPCPTIESGSVIPKTEVIDGVTITFTEVSEQCCSNESLQSKLPGKWFWDGSRCILNKEDDSLYCENPTTITISETPIDITNLTCNDNRITLSAYVYFQEPENTCTEGVLNEGNIDPLVIETDGDVSLYTNPPETTSEIAQFGPELQEGTTGDENKTPQSQNTKCCYDTTIPIEGNLIVQDTNKRKIDSTSITYVDTFISRQTTINSNVGGNNNGFNTWVRLTTVIDLNTVDFDVFNLAVEFSSGLFECCNYDIYFDDIDVGCLRTGYKENVYTEPCVGFDLSSCVIDNKKSWVYNPGKSGFTTNSYDQMVRDNGTNGMNIETTGIVKAGGHGPINRVFAPSVDAELDFRDTDYYNLNGVIEKHSKLVLNSKQLTLQFNMCADSDCTLGAYGYLLDDDGGYIIDDDGGRVIVQDNPVPFPNLVELERYKKSFQSFWMQMIEQFIPATTIFIGGEKWCNSRVCDEKIVNDYLLDSTVDGGELSPPPVQAIPQKEVVTGLVLEEQNEPVTDSLGEPGNTIPEGDSGNTNRPNDETGPIIVGDQKLYAIQNLDPELSSRTVITRELSV